MLMQKSGIPVPSNAVGSTQWAQQRGLIRQPQNRAAGLLGETAGLISPVVASAKAPQSAQGLLRMEQNASSPTSIRRLSERGMAYLPQDELTRVLLEQLKAAKGQKVGLRVIPHDQAQVSVGDALPLSHQWVDGNMTKRKLVGTSSASIGRGTVADIQRAIKNLGIYERGPNGYYFGPKIALIGGDDASTGADVGEKVIKNAKALWVGDHPRFGAE
jgi:hypothetical protein